MEKNKTKKLAVVKKADKKKDVWLGSQSLMGSVVPNSKEGKERALVNMTARVLDVSPFGVNILGSLPYINELGLKQKNEHYGKGKNKFVYNWVKRAMDDVEKAICECKIVDDKGKDITDWVTGECSPSTMKMSTLKGYQNHMAQTRARNRAIKEAYGVSIHEDMMANIQKFYKGGNINEKQKELLEYNAGVASSVSMEEIELDKDKKGQVKPISSELFTSPSDEKNPVEKEDILLCQKCDGIISQAGADFSKRLYGKQLCRECCKTMKPIKK